MEVIVIVLLIILIALSAVMLYREFQRVSGRMDAIEEKSKQKDKTIEDLDERMKKLEQANRKRMPWDALEKLENARAALNREKEEREFHLSLIANAEAWLDQVAAIGTKRDEQK